VTSAPAEDIDVSSDDSTTSPTPRPPAPPSRGALARLGDFWAQPTTRFALLFFVYLLAIALSYPAMRIRLAPTIEAMEHFTADVVYTLMSTLSSEVRMNEHKAVFFGKFVVTIIEECTGLYEALLLSAALLAFPTTWRKALLGFAIGFPLIYAMNIVRICVLLAIGRYSGDYFEFFHLYFWQVTMVLMVATTWLVWVKWVVRNDYEASETATDQPG
jgi:exosortase H (IPTLxxWG-CTERM-specific)